MTIDRGHIFISYAREDQDYARNLAESLRRQGFDPWMDDRIDPGARWWSTIVEQVRSCGAFVVVMTPEAEKSEWVERECLLALNAGREIVPLLLRGAGFAALVNRQYIDVSDGGMPPPSLYGQLKHTPPVQSKSMSVLEQPTSMPSRVADQKGLHRHRYDALCEVLGEITPEIEVILTVATDKGRRPAFADRARLLHGRLDEIQVLFLRNEVVYHALTALGNLVGTAVSEYFEITAEFFEVFHQKLEILKKELIVFEHSLHSVERIVQAHECTRIGRWLAWDRDEFNGGRLISNQARSEPTAAVDASLSLTFIGTGVTVIYR